MEKFRCCPICLQVPEQEIFQCPVGHIICHLCIAKISGSDCPQCRTPFGEIKIRCRVLEEILDSEEFPCKFSEHGCTNISKREEITKHVNSCKLNPDLIPLCAQMGLSCHFHLGAGHTRAETLKHFADHKIIQRHLQDLTGEFNGETLRNFIANARKRKLSDNEMKSFSVFLLTQDDSDTSPLFLLYGEVSKGRESFSFVAIQVWRPKFEKYNVEFTLIKTGLSASKKPELGSSTAAANNGADYLHLFPMTYTIKVCTIYDAHLFLKDSPINISLPFLRESAFGKNKYHRKSAPDGDRLQIKLVRANYI